MGKSSYHRSKNKFRFKTFHEHIAGINIDAVRKLKRTLADPDGSETFFGEAFVKWSDLNVTENFVDFCKKMTGKHQTLAILVHHQNEVVDILREHLENGAAFSMEPLLDLLVQLARDLQSDFYQYFYQFFDVLVKLLQKHDHNVEVLTQIFTCIAYLYKFLWRHLMKDIKTVYTKCSCLLSKDFPPHINTFAGESFSFLIRKSRQPNDILHFVMDSATPDGKLDNGIARLLFETVKGVQKGFHTCLDNIVTIVVEALRRGRSKKDQYDEILCSMVEVMTKYATPQSFKPVWEILFTFLGESQEKCSTKKEGSKYVRSVSSVIQILQVIQESNDGQMVIDERHMVDKLYQLSLMETSSESDREAMLELLSNQLKHDTTMISIHAVLRKWLNSKLSHADKITLCFMMSDIHQAHNKILPAVLEYCQTYHKSSKSPDFNFVTLVTQILIYSSNASSFKQMTYGEINCDHYTDKSGYCKATFPWLLSEVLKDADRSTHLTWSTLFCVSKLSIINEKVFRDGLQAAFTSLCAEVKNSETDSVSELLQWTLFECVSCLKEMLSSEEYFSLVSADFILALVEKHPAAISVLSIADSYFSHAALNQASDILTQVNCDAIFKSLQFNLSSPFAQKRWLTLSVLRQFSLPVDNSGENNAQCVFTKSLQAEETEIALESYRERVRLLSRLEYRKESSVPCPVNRDILTLRFLLGNLYVNFAPVWKPVCELITSYAVGMDVTQFWEVYASVLQSAAEATENVEHARSETIELPDCSDFSEEAVLSRYMDSRTKQDDRPDHINFRLLLWTAMNEFPGLAERKSRLVAPLLFRYMENEYTAGERKITLAPELEGNKEENMEDDEEEEDGKSKGGKEMKDAEDKSKVIIKRHVVKTLVMHLDLFAQFKNPTNVHLGGKLRDLYLELLQERNENIAKSALKCLMTFKHDYLQPYAEHLEKLIDGKSFKDELVLFNIEEEYAPVVRGDHRENLMPILMRILHGKMMAKGAKDTSGQHKKDSVMRFLASCKAEELQVFLELVFAPVRHLCCSEEELETRVAELIQNKSEKDSLTLRQQTGVMGTLELIMKRLPHLLIGYLPKLYSVLVSFSAMYTSLLQNRADLPSSALNATKSLRQTVMARLCQFFSTFDTFPFSARQINALFAAVVWPQIEKLPHEGIYSPTPLMKLLIVWSKEPRYYQLLAKKKPDGGEISILPFVFELLTSANASGGVTACIMEMVGQLVRPEEETMVEEDAAMETRHQLDVGPRVNEDITDVPVGISLLLPHIPSILKFIHATISKASTFARNSKGPLLELQILSSLSEHAPPGEQCEEIAVLLFAIATKNIKTDPELYNTVLSTLKALLTKVVNVKQFVQAVAELFSTLTNRASRTHLCKVFEVMAEQDADLKEEASVAMKLNSWDGRHVDEPDYLLRLEGFEDADRIIKQQTNTRLMVLLVHNCSYVLAMINDMALKDAARQCLENMISVIQQQEDNKDLYREIIVRNLLKQVKKNAGNFEENPRNEFLLILSCLVRTFPAHSDFSDLHQVVDADVEVDFFHNIVHIQVHRRSRAMKKLARFMLAGKFNRNTILTYVLPLTTAFTQEDVYAKCPDLADAAVTTIGAAAKCLPWPRYHQLLRYHIRKTARGFARQKLLIRIVVAILDNFHFDLRRSHEAVKAAGKTLPGMIAAPERVITVDSGAAKQKHKDADDDDDDEEEDMEIDLTEEDKEEEEEESKEESVSNVCTPAQAVRIERTVMKDIIPQLYKSLAQKSKSEDAHKKAMPGKYAEDDEILNVPISLAMIKLLQAMPGKCLHQNLPNVLMKVCQFLRSRSKDIRVTARQTLIKILQNLGVTFIPYILRELNSALQRGYQKHVLGFTLHALLQNMTLTPGDLDPSLDMILAVCTEEIFGQVAEEKEVEGIVTKVFEARHTKAYFTFEIVAKNVKVESLPKLILHVKQILEGNPSFKKTQKAAEVLKQICAGVVENPSLETGPLLTFVYGLVSESFNTIKEANKSKLNTKADLRPQSTYILHKDFVPTRKKKVDNASQASLYILVEFGLQLLFMLLKKAKFSTSDTQHLQMLDPFVDCLMNSLSSKHVKVITSALKCFSYLFKFGLPTLKKGINSVCQQIFVLLNNYARGGAAKGDNYHLVVMAFKTVTVLVRDVTDHSITEEQLNVLLTYCELDTKDYTRQATAFTLLKAILSRKLVSPALPELIKHLEKLSVTSETSTTRQNSRQIVVQYMLDYPLGAKLRAHVEFYISQLDYEYENGRKSALEMVASMVKYFPRNLISEYSGLIFLPMSSQLVNDDSTSCRMLCSIAIKELLSKLPDKDRDALFQMCASWLSNPNPALKKLAVISIGLFVEVESASFTRHLSHILELLLAEIELATIKPSDTNDAEEKQTDQLLYSLLNLVLKMSKTCEMVTSEENQSLLNRLWAAVEDYLIYPHVWVQLVSGQLFGMLFQTWAPDVLVARAGDEQEHGDYLSGDFHSVFHSLCGKFTKQLSTPGVTAELADQIVRNLVYVAKVLRFLPSCAAEEAKSAEDKNASFAWLFKRLCREANSELANNPTCHTKRVAVMKWFAAISVDLGADKLDEYLPKMLKMVVREHTDANSAEESELKSLCKDVMDLWKELVGTEVFTRSYVTSHKLISEKREERKVARAQEAVSNPEIAARRTLKKNVAKKKAQKRKSSEVRVSRKVKFRKSAQEMAS